MPVVPRRARPKKDALSFVRNFDGNPASAESRAFTNGIARRIETLAEVLGFTIGELEEEAGLTRGTLFSVLSGRRQGRTSIELLVRVAKVLGDADVGYLATGEFQSRDAPFTMKSRRLQPAPTRESASLPATSKLLPGQTAFPGMGLELLKPQAHAVRVRKRRKPKARKKTAKG